ncbi:MAG: HlyD family efflux transporter periplasmic adaptor subunit [Saprospiraceae bacterium]|nr:HlyD family efflux transporter periplasmic adaptor subunit [Saprospiraceae bacterium]
MEAQASVLQVEQKRIAALFKAEAATQQQKDDVDGKVTVMGKQIEIAKARIDVLNAQIQSAKEAVRIQNKGIISEVQPLQKKGALLDDQLSRTRVVSPLAGTILTTYVDEGELVSPGKAMFKLADLTEMTLRAYLNGDQLAQVILGQQVTVYVDSGASDQKSYKGTISWISDKAEFTPKTIQTRDERSNLVYAMKVKVKNDGGIKIGMYGEVDLGAAKNKS